MSLESEGGVQRTKQRELEPGTRMSEGNLIFRARRQSGSYTNSEELMGAKTRRVKTFLQISRAVVRRGTAGGLQLA